MAVEIKFKVSLVASNNPTVGVCKFSKKAIKEAITKAKYPIPVTIGDTVIGYVHDASRLKYTYNKETQCYTMLVEPTLFEEPNKGGLFGKINSCDEDIVKSFEIVKFSLGGSEK